MGGGGAHHSTYCLIFAHTVDVTVTNTNKNPSHFLLSLSLVKTITKYTKTKHDDTMTGTSPRQCQRRDEIQYGTFAHGVAQTTNPP